MNYIEFLYSKKIEVPPCGFEPSDINPKLFGWQNDIVRWNVKKGKSCIFSDCGTGKTGMQLQFGKEVSEHTGMPVLIAAPLAVTHQTKAESQKFGTGEVTVCRTQADVRNGINITNYEMLEHFDAEAFAGIILDESSILKHHDSKTRHLITDMFRETPYKLCCTATPSPNDYTELGTHAEFLGIMTQPEMLSTFFTHDGGDTSKWRLKGHAKDKFFEWVASWACCLTKPQDLGYEQGGYDLPPLNVSEIVVKSSALVDGDGQEMLFAPVTQTLNERRAARRDSLSDRVRAAAEIANSTDEQVLVWCDLNAESEALTQAINGAVEVKGSDSSTYKENAMMGFTDGTNRVLVSKASIAGFGMNWQNCHKMIFVGLSDSFEAYYQAVRRCWRFGQTSPVDVYIIISDAEGAVRANIMRKQQDAQRMTAELVKYTKDILQAEIHETTRMSQSYITTERMEMPKWIA